MVSLHNLLFTLQAKLGAHSRERLRHRQAPNDDDDDDDEAKLSCTVYCNRSCLFVRLWVCYHDNSKLRASMLTKVGM